MSKISTRDKLIRTAMSLFQRQGYHATGTQELLEKAGVPRGSLYHHFPGGKAELARACVDVITDDVIREIREQRLAGKTPNEVVHSLAGGIADWLAKKKWHEGMLLPTLVHEFAASDPKMTGEINKAYLRIQNELVQMLVVDGMDTEKGVITAFQIMSFLDGAATVSRALRSKEPLLNIPSFTDKQK